MVCIHLRKLYQLCQHERLRLSGSDLIHFFCQHCGIQETCPVPAVEQFENTLELSLEPDSEDVTTAMHQPGDRSLVSESIARQIFPK